MSATFFFPFFYNSVKPQQSLKNYFNEVSSFSSKSKKVAGVEGVGDLKTCLQMENVYSPFLGVGKNQGWMIRCSFVLQSGDEN